MDFTSPILNQVPVVTEFNEDKLGNGEKGRMPRDWQSDPFGSPFAARSFRNIPRDEWKDQVEARTKAGSLVSNFVRHKKIKPKNQKSIPYCWIFAPVQAVQVQRVLNGQPHVELSPASAGAQIKNFRKVGGWGLEAIKWIEKHGITPTAMWPDTAVERRYLTDEAKQAALQYRATEWEDLDRSDFDGLFTALLLGFVCPIGIDRWGHEVLCVDPVVLPNGQFGVLILNSWGESYGEGGFAVLTESWIRSFDSEVLRVVTGDEKNDIGG